MDSKDEHKPLLKHKPGITIVKPKRAIIVEPIIFLFCFAVFGLIPISSQFIFVQIGKKYNYTQSGIGNHDNGSQCANVSHSDPTFILQQKIESESSTFSIYTSVLTTGPALISSLYLGGYSDRRGRRLGIILPIIGGLAQVLTYIFVIYFEASIYFLLIGSALNGMCGYFTSFFMAVMSYIADCTTHSTRSKRIAIAELIVTVGAFLSSFSLGYMISGTEGFLWPCVLLASTFVIALVYAIFFVPETVVHWADTSINIYEIAKDTVAVFTREKSSRRPIRLLFPLLSMVFLFLVALASTGVQSFFMMNAPLCFTSIELGVVSALICAIVSVGSAIGLVLFLKVLKLRDSTVCMIGCASFILRFTIFGLARTHTVIYLALGAGFFEFLAIPVMRSSLSKLISEHEQGSLFAAIAITEGLCGFAGNFLWNSVYASTLFLYDGFVFHMMAACVSIGFVLLFVQKCMGLDARKKSEIVKTVPEIQ